jgi:hypothetical protein
MKIEIKPVIKTATSLELDIVILESPSEGTKAHATYKIVGDGVLVSGVIMIEGAEYEAWGSDDNYIYNLILSKLGLERA